MASVRDDFDKAIIDALAKRSAYICSNPDCRALTIAPCHDDAQKFIYIGKVAHIAAASEGGPRFNPKMSSHERKSIDNGIFLCSSCADMVDKNKGIDFTVELLKEWKHTHESWVRGNLNKGVWPDAQTTQIFNVSSINQSGGITGGVINVGPKSRQLDHGIIKQLLIILQDMTRTVTVTCVMGDGEAFSFATQIKDFLVNQGYDVKGVNQSVFSKPVTGQQFNSETYTIIIGSMN